jgi:low affinity Fe/Cu permease
MSEAFRRFAAAAARWMGAPATFILAVASIVAWAVAGPVFAFSDTWQLTINTGTTIVTFLMVFLIQNTQNRDAKALHLKLDEVIRGLHGARNQLVDLEHMTDAQLDELQAEFQRIRQRAETRSTHHDRAPEGHGAGRAAG